VNLTHRFGKKRSRADGGIQNLNLVDFQQSPLSQGERGR
jgi:hypothetical protein